VDAGLNSFGVWIRGEGEKGAEGEVLDYWELGENFSVVHLDHSLVLKSANVVYQGALRLTLLILAHPAFTPETS
jgi:hypothetical protein